ncbi:MAG: DUF6607 family protein [Emticicia sp.]|nr:DUF6607 family protein [Emticicia sp.]
MKKYFLALFITCLLSASYAQKSEDIKAIKAQCGCHDVDFAYAETFSPYKDYKFHDRYHAGGTEYVFVIEESKDKIVIQHLLAIGDSMVVKHWREDWTYEDPNLLSFHKDNQWKYSSVPKEKVKKTWTQKVYEVNDAPRYEGIAQWSHANGKHLWESKVDAPLPRREYTKRQDYNVMKRGNRIYVNENGYLHEQDNDKILRKDGADVLIAQEKGLNDYRRTDTKKCEVTEKWWAENGAFWTDVRASWQEVFDKHKDMSIKQFVRTKTIDEEFKAIKKEKNTSEINRQKLREVLAKYVVFENDLVGKN